VFVWLGLTVGVVTNSMSHEERRAVFECDIVYVTAQELGFTFLRDNTDIFGPDEQVWLSYRSAIGVRTRRTGLAAL
jgi:preprotein translocase subunit SecA